MATAARAADARATAAEVTATLTPPNDLATRCPAGKGSSTPVSVMVTLSESQ
jgi:hypothetical protein